MSSPNNTVPDTNTNTGTDTGTGQPGPFSTRMPPRAQGTTPCGQPDARAVVRPESSVRRTARIVGILFLAGFLTYGVGSLIATGVVRSADRSDSTALFVTGAALMLLNSAIVIGIGSCCSRSCEPTARPSLRATWARESSRASVWPSVS